ncbi:2-dehydro-3-deoxy-6-phosphogalactonate aldolase [Uliginosibacterium sp. H1]|uniref:2-dehydro-3-deoxy-6-phosphogalactonate aldolase n=1 Tax=Uliginosibacterium sp. H1 TaxID=3114757 RepID=UPI002E173F58|nr:2-dehydro-3-deoxy-6-phosphogalactonate aldolase [Uliginosibacterium sp. H1]
MNPGTSTTEHFYPLPAVPLIAILRGLTPDEAVTVGQCLFDAGVRVLEVPLNRPGALACITSLRAALPPDVLIGAGTVLSPQAVADVAAAGGELIISPDCNPEVIRTTRERGLWSLPGVSTPTEAFAALRAGAQGIKIFPAEAVPPTVVKAWRAVLPAAVPVIPVGGITPESLAGYTAAGANGFGIGSQLYAPGRGTDELAQRARAYVDAWKAVV